jgi:KUP system potassium uptake protein
MSQSKHGLQGAGNTGQGSSQSALTLAALGVVFGDIGTSPLYAFKEAFTGTHGLTVGPENVLAALSALLWAVIVIVAIKYVWVVLSHDNDGEGGVLALTALAHRVMGDQSRRSRFVVGAGVFAAALFYGDAIITPAISVLSAVEGMSIATPEFEHFIVPITIGILIGLFSIQMKGTSVVGSCSARSPLSGSSALPGPVWPALCRRPWCCRPSTRCMRFASPCNTRTRPSSCCRPCFWP